MNNDFWKLKIQAFLHDPPEKAIMLMRGEKHKDRAKTILEMLVGEANIPEVAKCADHIAAASSRVVVDPGKEKLKEFGQPKIRFHEKPVLIHPLSGKDYDLKKYGGDLVHYDWEGNETILTTAGLAVDEVLAGLKSSCDDDLKKLFFALWRLLPEQLAESKVGEEKSQLGHLWHLLPADTRTPDHSIWDHLSVTAAVATALPKPAFLLFSIGPVQSFISTARRTQDLWMGSYLLSYLTWCAAKAVVEEMGPDAIVFPNLYSQPLVDHWLSREFELEGIAPNAEQLAIANFPNRFLAIVPEEKAPKLAQSARKRLFDEWREVWGKVKDRMEREGGVSPDEKWNKLWEDQTKHFFESYWVAFPWCMDGADPSSKADADAIMNKYRELLGKDALSPGEKQDFGKIVERFHEINPNYVNVGTAYQLLYDLCERALGARKALRNFSQSAEEGYKCALCGEREALYSHIEALKGNSKEERIRAFWDDVSKNLVGDFKRGGGERLCAVCTTKRLAIDAFFKERLRLKEQRFPSTSSIAVASFQIDLLEGIKRGDDSLRKAFSDYVQKIGELKAALSITWSANSVYQAWGLVRSKDFPSELREMAEKFLHTDGDFLFEESFDVENIKKEYLPGLKPSDPLYGKVEKLATEARNALCALLQAARVEDITKPSRYLAMVCSDGDNMGKWLSGAKAPDILSTVHPHLYPDVKRMLPDVHDMRRPLSPFLHNSISASLRDFSTKLVRYVIEERHAGKLVYAGGDDFVALLPKEEAIPAARELRLIYSGLPLGEISSNLKSNNGFVKWRGEILRMMGETATLSTGIAIVHHSHSLTDAIHKAHQDMLEGQAKKRKGKDGLEKNSLAVASIRRSGEMRIAASPWFADGKPENSPIDVLIEFRELFAQEKVSPRFVYALGGEVANGLKAVDENLISSRVRHLLERHIELPKKEGQAPEERKKEKEKLAQSLADKLMGSLEPLRSTMPKRDNGKEPQPELDELLHLLELAVFLAREERA